MADASNRRAECPDCEAVYEGGFAHARLGTHRKAEHGFVKGAASSPLPPVEADAEAGSSTYSASESRPGGGPTPTPPAKKGVLGKLRAAAPTLEKTAEKKPGAHKRMPTAPLWGDVTDGFASLAGKAGYVPMQRAMVWSSPVAGEIIEEATKGGMIDKLVQPVVRNAAKWEDLFDLIGFWGAVGFAQQNPETAPQALAFARKRLVNLLPRIADKIVKERAKEKKAAEAVATLMPDLAELGFTGEDPIGDLMQMLFAPPAPYEAPVPEEAVA